MGRKTRQSALGATDSMEFAHRSDTGASVAAGRLGATGRACGTPPSSAGHMPEWQAATQLSFGGRGPWGPCVKGSSATGGRGLCEVRP